MRRYWCSKCEQKHNSISRIGKAHQKFEGKEGFKSGKCDSCGAEGTVPVSVWNKLRLAALVAAKDFDYTKKGENELGLFIVDVKVVCCEKPDWTWY